LGFHLSFVLLFPELKDRTDGLMVWFLDLVGFGFVFWTLVGHLWFFLFDQCEPFEVATLVWEGVLKFRHTTMCHTPNA
jgi:hypothetical protein